MADNIGQLPARRAVQAARGAIQAACGRALTGPGDEIQGMTHCKLGLVRTAMLVRA